ncbi:MAG: hypothetical protein MJZ34_03140 [Paludibacteraceae bacterium]|nr:hypothetical protein [Paludibacteraceae bacterium]
MALIIWTIYFTLWILGHIYIGRRIWELMEDETRQQELFRLQLQYQRELKEQRKKEKDAGDNTWQ